MRIEKYLYHGWLKWPGKYETLPVRKSNQDFCTNPVQQRSAKWGALKWQIGGAANLALASFWIDLRKVCQSKSWPWDTADSKKVWMYGAKMHIEGCRSMWRKIIRSGGIRSSNWLSSQLENLTTEAAALVCNSYYPCTTSSTSFSFILMKNTMRIAPFTVSWLGNSSWTVHWPLYLI